MSHRPTAAARPLLVAMMLALLASLAPVLPAAAQNDRGLIDETSYQSPQFGYTLAWAEPWTVRDRDVITNPGGFDTITLRSDTGTLRISGRADTYNPLTFLQDTIAIQLASGGEVINQDTTGGVPTAELLVGQDKMRLDVVSVPSAGAVVLISLRAPEASFPDALASAQSGVTLNDGPILGGAGAVQPPATEAPVDTTATAETPVGTAAATEPPVSTVVPTSTVEVLGSGIEGSTYTSPNFGFSVTWDPAIWVVPDDAEYSEPGYDALQLDTDTGRIWVTGVNAYDGNAASCLVGEQTYYNSPDLGITEWQVAVDANGNELTGESENRAWGVFTNVYTDPENPSAEPQNFVDYIECVSLGDGESVVIFYTYATREAYNDHIGKVVTLIESLDTPAAPASPTATTPAETPTIPAQTPTGTATETPTATATATATETATTPAETPATTPTGAAQTPATTATAGATTTPVDLTGGDTVEGQTYAYSFQIPPGWQVIEATLGGEIERTVLTNGTSTVSVEARAMNPAALSDCVANVAGEHQAQPIYTDLELALTSSGDPFSGEDDFSAFANFTFTGPDGSTWAHFVECRWIVQGESVLVVVQDVQQEKFGAERPARRQIQNSIEIGG